MLNSDNDGRTFKFSFFFPLSMVSSGDIGINDWSDLVTTLRDDLREVLAQPAEKFWELVKKDNSLHQCITSFLQSCPRPHDFEAFGIFLLSSDAPKSLEEDYYSLYNVVFLICLRMSTTKELKDASEFASVIYDTFAFDIPKIMDLCSVYGSTNSQLLSKMITNIFTEQPLYNEDLKITISALTEVFEKVSVQIQATTEEEIERCHDLISYFVDSAYTLKYFVEIYPPASELLYKEGFPERIASFYDNVVPQMDRLTSGINKDVLLRKHVHRGRVSFIKLFRDILTANLIGPILETRNESSIQELLDFLQLTLSYRAFVADYERCFPVWDDLQMLKQVASTVDDFTFEYINEGYRSIAKEYTGISNEYIPIEPVTGPSTNGISAAESVAGPSSSRVYTEEDIKLDLIQQVQDMLQDFGEGFIEACLDYYGNNVEQVINAILEDNLPPHLATMDRLAARITTINSHIDNVNGITDDSGELQIGKKGRKGDRNVKNDEVKQFIEDKKSKAEFKDLVTKFARIDTEGSVYDNMGPEKFDEYDDEYDDTYDSYTIGKLEPNAPDPEIQGSAYNRSFVTPRVLQPRRQIEAEEDIDENEEEQAAGPSFRTEAFVENPEVVRQRMEERRQSQMRGRGRGRGGGAGPPRERDVVATPAWTPPWTSSTWQAMERMAPVP
ncbi:hypothetical protein QYM36_007135 [Artemia franciscana]|uniref:CUE domain-containing protein n=1 Tax=Artemia franciscana TaxID=6661 RepID=A0AA88HYY3_ARTSF|nr:hypothetical protein QYM36_007135 [Artemia franciscana]KAK2716888.1 hypothetical protein QYM36_007135 [Artemia franciscana]